MAEIPELEEWKDMEMTMDECQLLIWYDEALNIPEDAE
jgi:hypothetical protein